MSDERTGTSYMLLTVLLAYAPDASTQGWMTIQYNGLCREGLTGQELDMILADMLHDGLSYGNWPWTSIGREGPRIVRMGTLPDVEKLEEL